ncbi:MAG TPA: hypothetical protein VGQ82_03400 [Chthoniobacterales bacterium]|nr:hypothetical protein [Chthoniobacterales bacterium]
MPRSTLSFLAVSVVALIPMTPSAFAADATLRRVPSLTAETASAYPQNLARLHLGAKIESERPMDSSADSQRFAALLTSDPTAVCTLPSGVTTLTLSLPRIENVEAISFRLTGAKGTISVASSNAKLPPTNPQWHKLPAEEISSGTVTAKIGPVEAKYVSLTFDLAGPGQLTGLGVYAVPSIAEVAAPRHARITSESTSFGFVGYSAADLHSKARALYVSSGPAIGEANRMIDDQIATTYSFGPDDHAPLAILDLGKVAPLHRLAAAYSARPGKLDFYVLQSLPGTTERALPEQLTISENAFTALTPVGSIAQNANQEYGAVDFPTTSGRYVILRWTPAAAGEGAFTIAEIAAFGPNNANTLLAANGNVVGRQGSGEDKDAGTGLEEKGALEAKDVKDIPAEGPEEAPPSEGPPPNLPLPPPFTFIPQLVPTSP